MRGVFLYDYDYDDASPHVCLTRIFEMNLNW